jgi:hypothetical protein
MPAASPAAAARRGRPSSAARRAPAALVLLLPVLVLLLGGLDTALAQNNFAALAQRAAPYVRNAATAAAYQLRQRQERARGGAGGGNNNNNGNGNGNGPFNFEPPVDRPDRPDNGGGCNGGGCGGGCNGGGCGGGGGGGWGGFVAGISPGAIVGVAGAGVDGYISLTQPLVENVASKIPIDVPAVFADGTVCKFGQPFQDAETGRLMCRLGDMGQVANYGYRALGVATNVGLQAANAFLGRRRSRALLGGGAEAAASGAPSTLSLEAQQALLANIPLPSWAR